MENQVTLLAYLQQAPPSIGYFDICDWPEFNIATILQEFGPLLNLIHVEDDLIGGTTPQREITSESGLHLASGEYFHPRIRRSLRYTFQRLNDRAERRAHVPSSLEDDPSSEILDRVLDHGLPERTTVFMGVGSDATTPNQYTPDLSFYVAGETDSQRRSLCPNRLPGDMKPSWKWSHSMGQRPIQYSEFSKALSQVNWYMDQHNTQFSFILTERELVPIRRVSGEGDLRLANPIPWTQHGTLQEPKLTVALGLWYLGMMAANDRLYHFP